MRQAVHERKRFDVRCDIFALSQDFCLIFSNPVLFMQILIYLVRKVAKSSKHARGKARDHSKTLANILLSGVISINKLTSKYVYTNR